MKSKTLVQRALIQLLRAALRLALPALQVQDGCQIQRLQREALLVFVCKATEEEVGLRVLTALDIEAVLDELQKNSLHRVDLAQREGWKGLCESAIFEALVVSDLACDHEGREGDFLPVRAAQRLAAHPQQLSYVDQPRDRNLALHLPRVDKVFAVVLDHRH